MTLLLVYCVIRNIRIHPHPSASVSTLFPSKAQPRFPRVLFLVSITTITTTTPGKTTTIPISHVRHVQLSLLYRFE